MSDLPPAVLKKTEELFERVKDLLASHQQGIEILSRMLALQDVYALKTRSLEMCEALMKIHGIAAQIEILRGTAFEMEAPSAVRRASTRMSALTPEVLRALEEKKDKE